MSRGDPSPDTPPPAATDAGDSEALARRRPITIPFDPDGGGEPGALLWDEGLSTLFIADSRNNTIWTWSDQRGLEKLVRLPDDLEAQEAGATTSLGQFVRRADGTLLVPRLGFNDPVSNTWAGSAIVHVNPADGSGATLPGLATNLVRPALVQAATGELFGIHRPKDITHNGTIDAGFSPANGAITRVTLDAGETVFSPPAGACTPGRACPRYGWYAPESAIVQDGRIFVADRDLNFIGSVAIAGDGTREFFGPQSGSLGAGPGGALIATSKPAVTDRALTRVLPDGGWEHYLPFARLVSPRAVAYDAKQRRVFVSDSDGASVRRLMIFPDDGLGLSDDCQASGAFGRVGLATTANHTVRHGEVEIPAADFVSPTTKEYTIPVGGGGGGGNFLHTHTIGLAPWELTALKSGQGVQKSGPVATELISGFGAQPHEHSLVLNCK
jgi:hypothetical protein